MNTRRYQYSLRTLFVAVTIVSVPGLWIGVERSWAQRERRAAAAFVNRGGQIETKPQWDLLMPRFVAIGRSSSPPQWLHSALGEECFSVVVAVHGSGANVGDDDLNSLPEFTCLEVLDLSRTRVSDEGMPRLGSLRRLVGLSLWRTKVTGKGLSVLETLPELRALALDSKQLTPTGVASLQRCPKLASLSIRGTAGLSGNELDRIRAKFPGVYVDLD